MNFNKLSFLFVFGFAGISGNAQVAKSIVAEHFTNTRCSVCASQNPSYYQILTNHPEVKHIAYHPTSPYVNCVLAQHNAQENDARTNYYGVYGSTPRLAINGQVISNNPNPYENTNLYDPFQGQTSEFSLRIYQFKEADTIRIHLALTTVANHSFTQLRLYSAVAEDTIFYSSPNGESLHHDVFRKSFFGTSGLLFQPAESIGDSVVFEGKLARNSVWNFNRIFAYALIQSSENRALVQAGFANPSEGFLTQNFPSIKPENKDLTISPNPSTSGFYLNSENGIVKIIDQLGRQVFEKEILGSSSIVEPNLPNGIYQVILETKSGIRYGKWVKNSL
jgi:hypothetical protein